MSFLVFTLIILCIVSIPILIYNKKNKKAASELSKLKEEDFAKVVVLLEKNQIIEAEKILTKCFHCQESTRPFIKDLHQRIKKIQKKRSEHKKFIEDTYKE